MFQRLNHRAAHYALIALAWALLCLPNLGGPSLWDVDESRNSGAAIEMYDSGNWIVPTFNYELRADKPVLLYWLQAAGYAVFGIGEFAARLPSALAALLAMLCAYELARDLFGRGAGLLAGALLGSTIGVCAAGHFANPDSLLNGFTCLSLTLFWIDYARNGRSWFLTCGVATGIAVLAKGPVGLLLPGAVAFLFLLWQRDLRRLLDRSVILGAVLFVLVAAPWYVWVGLETKGKWLSEFWNRHHVARMGSPMENHGGPIFYYVLVLLVGLAPWSIFAGATGWHFLRRDPERDEKTRSGLRFLTCWFGVYFVAFSLAQTKLPNYVLPLYPAAAVLLAGFLDRWRRGLVQLSPSLPWLSIGSLGLIGVGTVTGMLIASGVLPGMRGRAYSGLERYLYLALPPLLGAIGAGWCLLRGSRNGFVGTIAVCSVAFTAGLAALGAMAIDTFKAPRNLVASMPADQTKHEVRVATFGYFQPSLVFYTRREVLPLHSEAQALEFLKGPHTKYLFLPADAWEVMAPKAGDDVRLLGRHYDLYDRRDVVVVEARHE
jgi:4-amino-4-deoxy-L-arabinose transferase-like glycosyltransferase